MKNLFLLIVWLSPLFLLAKMSCQIKEGLDYQKLVNQQIFRDSNKCLFAKDRWYIMHSFLVKDYTDEIKWSSIFDFTCHDFSIELFLHGSCFNFEKKFDALESKYHFDDREVFAEMQIPLFYVSLTEIKPDGTVGATHAMNAMFAGDKIEDLLKVETKYEFIEPQNDLRFSQLAYLLGYFRHELPNSKKSKWQVLLSLPTEVSKLSNDIWQFNQANIASLECSFIDDISK